MDRRTYLGTVGIAGLTSVAGCLDGVLGSEESGNPDTVLEPPETDLSDASHPSYGDEFPAVSVPDPFSGETISTDQFEGERAMLMTFVYTNCPDGMCPALTLRLRRAQEVAADEGYGDEAAFLEMTFDPERDTEDAIRSFADQQGVDLDAENWHFLRPESYDEAKEIVDGTYGLPLKKCHRGDDCYTDEYEELEYMFPHFTHIFLVNKQGIVERVYSNGASMEISRLIDDFETVVTA